MALRQKSKRRIAWVLVSTAAIMVAGGSAVYVRSAQRERAALASRDAGMKMLAEGDYPGAMAALDVYLHRHPKNVEALYAMATARKNVEAPEAKHLGAAIFYLRQVVNLDPGRMDAQHDLLDLYTTVRFDPEATRLADTLLARDPNDLVALRAKAGVLMRAKKFQDALAVDEQRLKASPGDTESRLMMLEALANAKGLDAAIARADADVKADPSDAARWLARSAATLGKDPQAGFADLTKARELLMARRLTDADYVLLRQVLQRLDLLGQWAPAVELSARAAADGVVGMDADVLRREFYAGRSAAALERATKASATRAIGAPGGPKLNPEAAAEEREYDAVRAMILCLMGEREKSGRVVATLGSARKDWADAINAMLSPTSTERELIPKLEEIVRRRQNAPLFLMALGDAYERAGDSESAMQNWRMATASAPSWGAPLLKLSGADLRLGRLQEAFDLATRARVVSPGAADADVTAVTAWAEAIRWRLADNQPELLRYLDEYGKSHPGDPRVHAMRARAYAAKGQAAQVRGELGALLASPKPPAREVLLEGAVLAQDSGAPEVEAACIALAVRTYGWSPVVAAAAARGPSSRGDFAGAIKVIEAARGSAANKDDADWGIVYVAMLERSGDAAAKDKWVKLADENPGSAKVQWAAVSSKAAQADPAFVTRAFDRLKDIMGGEQGLSLRIARAGYAVERSSDKDELRVAALSLGEVTRVAPKLLMARLLLAEALEKLGNMTGAVEQQTAAASLASGSPDVRLELAAMLQRAGNAERARAELDRAMSLGQLTPAQSRRAATIAGRLNDPQTAVKLLAGAGSSDRNDLELAGYLRQEGEYDKVDAVVPKLLASRNVNSIAFAADYLGSRGRLAEGKAALAKLDSADAVDPFVASLVRGDYYLRYDTTAAAAEQYEAAAKANPKDARPWRRLISAALRAGNADQALATARRASDAVPSDAAPRALLDEGAALAANLKEAPYAALVRGLLDAPEDQVAPIREAMKAASSAARDLSGAQAKLKALADEQTRCLPIQVASAMVSARAGKLQEAATVSRRAMDAFPGDATSAQIAAQAYGALGRTDEARAAGKEWASRMAGDRIAPDFFVGMLELQGGQAEAALERLEPHVARAIANPQQYAGVLLYYGRAKIVANRADEFEALVRPLLPTSSAARSVMASLAGTGALRPDVAGKWLAEVDAATPAKAYSERVALASSLALVAARGGPPSVASERDAILSRLGDEGAGWENVTAEAVNAFGQLREQAGDIPGAEAAYRKALALDPKHAVANNNLAMIIVRKKGSLPEALDFATRAAATEPTSPGYTNFLDTKATVLEAMSRFDDAIAAIQAAVAREPTNVEWLIHLASLQLQGGKTAQAKQTLDKVTQLSPNSNSLSPDSLTRLKQLDALNKGK